MPESTTSTAERRSLTYGRAIPPSREPFRAGDIPTLFWVPCDAQVVLTFLPADAGVFSFPEPTRTPSPSETVFRMPGGSPADETIEWLKVAEGAFRFWDNSDDDAWDRV